MPSLFDERASNSCAQSWMAGVRRFVTSKELVTWCCRLGHRCDLELNSGSSRRFSIALASTSSTCNWKSVTLTNSKLLRFGVFDRRPRLGVARTRILRRKKNTSGFIGHKRDFNVFLSIWHLENVKFDSMIGCRCKRSPLGGLKHLLSAF